MTAAIVSALKTEIAQLEDELRSDPRQRKLARLREALAEYEPVGKDINAFFSPTVTVLRTKGDKIKAEITNLLQQRGTIHRKEILTHLTAIGLMGHEKAPLASLAAYLTGWNDIFEPDGGGNWSLKQPLRAAE